MTTQKNGSTIPTNGKQPVVTTLTVATKTDSVKVQTDFPPLEDRILRINQLFDLQSRYNRLLKGQSKLAEFKLKKGEENISCTIRDNNSREEFSTTNPELVNAVLDCVRVTVQDKKKALEPLLKW